METGFNDFEWDCIYDLYAAIKEIAEVSDEQYIVELAEKAIEQWEDRTSDSNYSFLYDTLNRIYEEADDEETATIAINAMDDYNDRIAGSSWTPDMDGEAEDEAYEAMDAYEDELCREDGLL